MRHEPEDIARGIADAGDVFSGTVRVGRIGRRAVPITIPEEYPLGAVQIAKRGGISNVTALSMRDREVKERTSPGGIGPRGGAIFNPRINVLTAKMQIAIANECARQQMRFTQNLKAVADAEHELASIRFSDDRFHDGRKPGDRAASEIVAVRKTSREHDEIVARHRLLFMPDVLGRYAQIPERADTILIAIGPWEANHGGFHAIGEVTT